jgi:hypothetical protein
LLNNTPGVTHEEPYSQAYMADFAMQGSKSNKDDKDEDADIDVCDHDL